MGISKCAGHACFIYRAEATTVSRCMPRSDSRQIGKASRFAGIYSDRAEKLRCGLHARLQDF